MRKMSRGRGHCNVVSLRALLASAGAAASLRVSAAQQAATPSRCQHYNAKQTEWRAREPSPAYEGQQNTGQSNLGKRSSSLSLQLHQGCLRWRGSSYGKFPHARCAANERFVPALFCCQGIRAHGQGPQLQRRHSALQSCGAHRVASGIKRDHFSVAAFALGAIWAQCRSQGNLLTVGPAVPRAGNEIENGHHRAGVSEWR
jgi:hypothetical protein